MKKVFQQFARIFGWKPKPKRDFPPWCRAMCHGALNEMRVAIESKGIRLKEHDITVRVRFDVQQKAGGWGWWVEVLKLWAGAITHATGKLIEIAANPILGKVQEAIHEGSLQHEMGHHWLICNGHGGGHDPKFDDVIPGWAQARRYGV